MYDLAIIGGGPAGLTAAIKAGTEGLSAVVLEKSDVLGGRPYMSPLIENVPGFPEGIDGPTLFNRLARQAERFGAELHTGQGVTALMRIRNELLNVFTPRRTYYARAAIIAVGEVTPKIDALRGFEGCGVEYACDATALHQHKDEHVLLVGGGNSCAQLALSLVERGARRVTILSRSDLGQTTSMYLRQRLALERDVVRVIYGEIASAHGLDKLARVSVEVKQGKIGLRPDHTYVFISGVPAAGWFPGSKTAEGYILTGHDVPKEDWPLERAPYPQESSVPGVFVAGDVRAGATGGITVAFGEGTQAFQWIKREYLPGLAQPAREEVKA